MKNLFVSIIALAVIGCNSASPGPGDEAVLIHKPLVFGSGGVNMTPVKTGRKYVAWTTEIQYVNMKPMIAKVHLDDFMTADGVPLDFDAVVRVQIIDSARTIRDYGLNWYDTNVGPEFVRFTRDAVKKHGMNETALTATASDEIDTEVTTNLGAYFKSNNFPWKLLEVTLGRANPPDAVKGQRVSTAQQEQRVNTENQRKNAEVARLTAEQARAAADNAYRLAMNLTPDQYLTLENIKMLHDVCAGGKCTFFLGGAEGTVQMTKAVQ